MLVKATHKEIVEAGAMKRADCGWVLVGAPYMLPDGDGREWWYQEMTKPLT